MKRVREGDWKLYLAEVKDIPGSDKGPVLIYLKDDPAENINLSEEHPEKVQAMRALAKALVADIEAAAMSLGGPPSSE